MEKQWEHNVRSGIYGLCVADALGVPGEGRNELGKILMEVRNEIFPAG